MLKHVYILGAGFSYPLGGPLFNELLTPTSDRYVEDQLRGKTHPRKSLIENFGKSLRKISDKDTGLDLAWDAEQWIENISSLLECNQTWLEGDLFSALMSHHGAKPTERTAIIKELLTCLNIRLAIETTSFLKRIPSSSERWIPYQKWYGQLGKNDTIATFNYDMVCERLARSIGQSQSNPCLLKMHGSANWMSQNSEEINLRDSSMGSDFDIDFALSSQILIGAPGQKSDMAERVLKDVWDQAQQRIEEANVVSIVGYSMPATDSYAREFILNAICKNLESKIAVDVVLGPSAESPNANRMKEMFSRIFSFERYACVPRIVPAYAQDYIGSYRYLSYRDYKMTRPGRFHSVESAEDWAKRYCPGWAD